MKDNSRSPNDGFHRYLKPGALAQIRNSRINNAIHLLPSCLAHYRIRHLLLKRYRRHASSSVQVASYSLSKISPASALCLFPLYSAATRWCHGASWRSPASLRAQTRITALVLEQFKRKFATIGNYLVVYLCFISSLACNTRIPCLLCCFILHFGDTVVHFNTA
ncbi:uncharacterized protein LOC130494713 [Raphanus sativus]|uniref:Uncharacterized protein LOC130494713 n=1 Tax=Raphanus sativus TaxID=3726 RepID=A0A9W3CD16_RAPSA|nr:uncharacterized protein LOC130494713 [Raphanus sativus]